MMTDPLPTDLQVVRAIKDRKQQFMENYKSGMSDDYHIQKTMYFHHICTVLTHAEKLFSNPVEQWMSLDDWESAEEPDSDE